MRNKHPKARGVVLAAAAVLALGIWLLCWWTEPSVNEPKVAPDAHPAAAQTAALEVAVPTGSESAAGLRIDANAGAAAADVGRLLVEVSWSDGSPAPGITVGVVSKLAFASTLQSLSAVTDPHGRAAFESVLSGPVGVRVDRGSQVSAVVARGEETRVRLQIEAGLEIGGRVEDGRGRPVPGAMIWLTRDPTGSWMSGSFVTRSDSEGGFSLRDVPRDQTIVAVAEGFCPSELFDLEAIDTSERRVWVVLRMTAPGGGLVTHVVDHVGDPVEGAIVAVGEIDRTPRTLTEDPPSPRAGPTDAEGRCAMVGMAPGEFPVEVMSSEAALWRGRAHIEVGQTTELRVTLQPGESIHGTVRSLAGKPLANVLVVALPCKTPENGSIGPENLTTFSHPAALSGADGGFVLRRVPPGEAHLLARAEARGAQSGSRPWVVSSLLVAPGGTLRWDPVLDPGLTIQGVIRRPSGQPVAGAVLTLAKQGASRSQGGFSDASGQFSFLCLEQVAYDLTVLAPDQLRSPIRERGIVPGNTPIEVIVAAAVEEKAATGVVRGRVIDSSSLLRAGIRRWAVLGGRGERRKCELENDAFLFLDVAAGEYSVSIYSGDDCVLRGGTFELAAGQDLTLGDLVTTPGGRAIVELDRWPGTQSREVCVRLFGTATDLQYQQGGVRTDQVIFENVVPGSYVVELDGRFGVRNTACATCRQSLVVGPGGTANCAFAVRPAAVLNLRIEFPPGHTVERFVGRGGQGWEFARVPRHAESGISAISCSLSVPMGVVTIEARTNKGAQGQCEVTVVEGRDPDGVVLKLQ